MHELSLREARKLAIGAQGLGAKAEPRAAPGHRRVGDVLRSLGVIQIDSVSAVARAHYVAPFARLGGYQRAHLDDLAYRHGQAFEYWGHEAALLPVESQPLFRWRMARAERGEGIWKGIHRISRERGDYVAELLAQIRDRGPQTAASLDEAGKRTSPWWGWTDAKTALEWLFFTGKLMRVRDGSFEIAYDLPERVLPKRVLATPTPAEAEAQRALVLHAVGALGVGTAADVADYFRMTAADTRARLAELVEAGLVEPATVESWRQPAFALPGASPGRRRSRTTFVSPFDSLVWNRDRTERLFGFRYRIEIYTPAPRRVFGYYVLPLLHDDRLVGRADVRAERKTGTLRIDGAFAEPGEGPEAVAEAMAVAAGNLARWLGLERIQVGKRGEVAEGLRRLQEAPAPVPANDE